MCNLSGTQPKEVENEPPEVSKCRLTLSPFVLPPTITSSPSSSTATSIRKRLTAINSPNKLSPIHTTKNDSIIMHDSIEMHKLKPSLEYCNQSNDDNGKLKASNNSAFMKKSRVYPFRNHSAEDFRYKRQDSSDRKSSSRDSSDIEFETYVGKRRQKNVSYKNEEKSQLICYKDNMKVITIKNDSKLTKYNTFDMKSHNKGKLVKYKSLDMPQEAKTMVKYLDPNSKVSISADDFNSNFKMTKFDRKKHKHDIITDTVDAWAKKGGKNVFSNIKNTLFKSNSMEKEVVYKPLVFGGTFPIDVPFNKDDDKLIRNKHTEPIKIEDNKSNCVNYCLVNQSSPKFRKYGPPKTFDIDRPI